MHPPIFERCKADSGVKAVLGNPPRLYLFGEAPPGVDRPYAVWQQVGGSPENYLGNAPDMDSLSAQIDAYASTAAAARGVAKALTDALEAHGYVTSWNGESRDPVTRDYRFGFTMDFMESR